MVLCDSFSRWWDLVNPPGPAVSGLSCIDIAWCPYAVIVGATPQCCGYANQIVCRGQTCRSDTNCPAVVSSQPRVTTPTPSPTPIPSPPRPSTVIVVPSPSSRIASSIIQSSAVARPSASGSVRTCSGTTTWTCGNGFFCSVDAGQCCPYYDGQSFCSGAVTCFRPWVGEKCCGNTICYGSQKCAPEGNSCIETASTSRPTTSSAQAPTSSAAPIVPTQSPKNDAEASAKSVLQTAVPSSVQADPAGACFLNSAYAAYTTPSWYTAMATPAQSYFASVNAQNTAACVANTSPSSGLSDGAKAGIGVGVPAAIACVGLLALVLIKTGIIGSAAAAAAASGGAAGSSAAATCASGSAPPAPAWSGVTGGEQAWNGVTGAGHPPPTMPPMHHVPPFIAAGAMRKSSDSSGRRAPSPIPYPPPRMYGSEAKPYSTDGYQAYRPPPRSVSPLDSYEQRPEMYGTPRPSEMSSTAALGPGSELSTAGAYPGHEIYSTERYEAPAGYGVHEMPGRNTTTRY